MLLALALAAPAAAGADCTIPGAADPTMDGAQDFDGSFSASHQGAYVQIPFHVPAGTKAVRVRYCFDQPPSGPSNTLDVGVFGPRPAGQASWGMAQRRGWSGSAVRDLAIAVDGFTDPATYEADRKAYVSGFTTRAYQPGPIPAGEWAVELGLAAITGPPADPDGVAWRVRVETSDDKSWSDDPYSPVAYDDSAANPSPGWYEGDLHAHGEQEPGNAPVADSLDYGFRPLDQGGAGLDFITIVDHNNDVFEGEAGRYQPGYPGRLIIPGTEVTTYLGHYNEQGSGVRADYRGGPVYRLDPGSPPTLVKTRDAVVPASQFALIDGADGWAQINHPTIFPGAPTLCRGCPWDYPAAETDFGLVDAIEVQTGPAEISTAANPFTATAIAFYEAALAGGAHLAAVGSSDSHQADEFSVTSAPIGRASTVVHAERLTAAAIVQGVRDDHTYVKVFGSDGPDIRLTATAPGAPAATIGDSLSGPVATLDAEVLGAGPGAARPGAYELRLLRDGTAVDAVAVAGDEFGHRFEVGESGRYSLEVVRQAAAGERIEVYSSPVWFERVAPSNRFRFGKLRRKRNGAAKLTVEIPGPGKLALSGKGLRTDRREPNRAGRFKLSLKPKGSLKRKLARRGRAKIRVEVAFRPAHGERNERPKRLKLTRGR